MKKYIGIMAILLIALTANVAFAKVCGITAQQTTVDCDGVCIVLNWTYVDDCGGACFTIQRRVNGAGNWTTLATGFVGNQYTDCPLGGHLQGWDYKVTIHCNKPCQVTEAPWVIWTDVSCP